VQILRYVLFICEFGARVKLNIEQTFIICAIASIEI